jgi:predicted  nucleic acid-binding Zn-ribbon protein
MGNFLRATAFRSLQAQAAGFGIKLDKDGTVTDRHDRRNTGSIATARASVATEGEIRSRFTATRILTLGVFALAFKKKTSDKDLFLTVDGDGFTFVSGPLKKNEKKARKFAQDFNRVAADWAEFGSPL